MKNVLIFGGTGFLGSHIYKYMDNKYMDFNIYHPFSSVINFLHFDDWKKYFDSDELKFDYIFHCGVYFKPGNFENDGENLLYNNIINTNILRYWKEYQPQAKLITFGSDAAYDPKFFTFEDYYLTEKPNSDYYGYALSKRSLYEMQVLLNQQYNMRFLHLPIITLYGSGYKKDDEHLIHSIVRKIIKAKYNNEIATFWGNGEQIREVVFIDDLVQNIFQLLEKDSLEYDIYNLGSNKKFKIKDYVKIICEKLEYDFSKVVFDINDQRGIQAKELRSERARKEIGGTYYDTNFENSIDSVIKYSLELYK